MPPRRRRIGRITLPDRPDQQMAADVTVNTIREAVLADTATVAQLDRLAAEMGGIFRAATTPDRAAPVAPELTNNNPPAERRWRYVAPAPNGGNNYGIAARAERISPNQQTPIRDTERCGRCNCAYHEHAAQFNHPCGYCGNCPRFVTQAQVRRARFTDFLRWSRRWVAENKKRSIPKLKKFWEKLKSTEYLSYCSNCQGATFHNSIKHVVKKQDGLQCSKCKLCATCCHCVKCEQCNIQRKKLDFCKTCNTCANNCCRCRNCDRCGKQCSGDYCGVEPRVDGCGYCHDCCECGDTNRVPFICPKKPKFHKPSLKQHSKNPTSRYIAAEIEVASIRGYGKPIYKTVKKWGGAVVRDGSLAAGGFEINTAPAGGDLYVEQVNEYCDAIAAQRGYTDDRCGLHVHVDGRDLNYYDLRRLVRTYAVIENGLFAMVPESRQASRYCHPCGQKYVQAIEEGKLPYDKVKTDVITSVYSGPSTQDLRGGKYHPSRYNALNLHSWFYRGTIECRMFDGSINANEIVNWGILWAMILDYSVKTTDEDIARQMISGKPITSLTKIVSDKSNSAEMLKFINNRVLSFGATKYITELNELMKK